MELVEIFKGHWLEPFRDRIISVKDYGDFWRVLIFTSMEELSLSGGDKDTMQRLGILEMTIETPIQTEWDMFKSFPNVSHTGEIYITLDIAKTKRITTSQKSLSV